MAAMHESKFTEYELGKMRDKVLYRLYQSASAAKPNASAARVFLDEIRQTKAAEELDDIEDKFFKELADLAKADTEFADAIRDALELPDGG